MDTNRYKDQGDELAGVIRIKKDYCTTFKKKNNIVIETLIIDQVKTEEKLKYFFLLRWYMGKLEKKLYNNIKGYVIKDTKLNNEAIELAKKFDKKYRLLISNK